MLHVSQVSYGDRYEVSGSLRVPLSGQTILIQNDVFAAFQDDVKVSSGNVISPPLILDLPHLTNGEYGSAISIEPHGGRDGKRSEVFPFPHFHRHATWRVYGS